MKNKATIEIDDFTGKSELRVANFETGESLANFLVTNINQSYITLKISPRYSKYWKDDLLFYTLEQKALGNKIKLNLGDAVFIASPDKKTVITKITYKDFIDNGERDNQAMNKFVSAMVGLLFKYGIILTKPDAEDIGYTASQCSEYQGDPKTYRNVIINTVRDVFKTKIFETDWWFDETIFVDEYEKETGQSIKHITAKMALEKNLSCENGCDQLNKLLQQEKCTHCFVSLHKPKTDDLGYFAVISVDKTDDFNKTYHTLVN